MVEADEKTIRQYLLGELAEAEMVPFEERLMTDGELFEMLTVVEDELIDERVGGQLSPGERAHFDAYFLSTPSRRERLEMARALHDYARRPAPVKGAEQVRDDGPLRAVPDVPSLTSGGASPAAEPPLPAPLIRSSRWSSRTYLGLAAAAIILIAIGLVAWPTISYRWDVRRGMAALNKAYTENPTSARITGLDYPPRVAERGGDNSGKVNKLALEEARGRLASAANQHPNAMTYQAAGRLFLAERDFDNAIQSFEDALKLESDNAELHSDLGAALFEKGKVEQARGESGKSFETFAQSHEHLTKAIALDGSLLEALFNRALCREALRLYNRAKEDWEKYIEKDPHSQWAEEARRKIKAMEERPPLSSQNSDEPFREFLNVYKIKDDEQAWKLISRGRDSAGSLTEDRLLDDYLDLTAQGLHNDAREKFEALAYAGDLAYRRAQDPFVADLVSFYKSATVPQRESASQARRLMKSARAGSSRYGFAAALRLYEKAKRLFERAGDQCEALYVNYAMGNCYVQLSKAEPALALFQPLAQACERAQYRRLLAQTLSAIANADMHLREFSAAMDSSKRAAAISKEIGDTVGVANAFFQLAEENRYVNNYQQALDLHVQNLNLMYACSPQPAELWGNYFSISLTLLQFNLWITAIDFQKEALQLALESEKTRLVCRSYNYLGMLLARHGDYTEAAGNIERALEVGDSFAERAVRLEATAPSFLQLGYIYRQLGDFRRAVEAYDQAIRAYDELDSRFFDFIARKDKLLCCLDQDGCDSVEQDIETLLKLFEEHRSKILEESNRNTFFDAEQSLYDSVIEFEYFKRKDPAKAFEYSERSRGRSLRDLINASFELIDSPDGPDMKYNHAAPPPAMGEVQRRIPQPVQVVQYAVLKNHVLIWVVSNDGFYCTSRKIALEDLNRRVNHFLGLVTNASEPDPEAASGEAADLYDLLIKPVEPWLDNSKVLCIVPDKILNFVPFEALKSPASGNYFIEDRALGIMRSPSSGLLVTCSEAARDKEGPESEEALVVGDPLYDRRVFSDLDELESAAREAETIAGYYNSPALIGAAATKGRVMSGMEQADVIHLATHAVTNEWYPLRSKLLLAKDAPGETGDGVLQAYEIYKLKLARARLVVLSACKTGVETFYGGEGMIGLSRPFIAKGIPLVVASLWRAGSASTADLMIRFHRYRKSGKPTVQALRLAQIDMMRDANGRERAPYHWAAFVAIGGYANF